MKQITPSEIAQRVLRGELFTTAEWRSSVAKVNVQVNDDDKTEEKTKVIIHQVEFVDFKTKVEMPYEIKETCSDDFNVEAYNLAPRPFKKGERVALEMKSFGWSQFKKRNMGNGIPYAIVDNTPAKK